MLPETVTSGTCTLCHKTLTENIPGLKITKGDTNIILCWQDYNGLRDVIRVLGPMLPEWNKKGSDDA